MSFINKILSLPKYLGCHFESAVKDSASVLKQFATLPFRDLVRVRKKNTSWKQKTIGLLLFPFKLVLAAFSVFVRILISPAELLVGLFNRKTRDILWTIPWIIGLVAFCSFAMMSWYNSGTRLVALRKSAIEAFDKGNYTDAEQKYAQLIQWNQPVEEADLLQWHNALRATNQHEKADDILKKLAPNVGSNPGHPPAHQLVAIAIVRDMKRPVNPAVLKVLKWHLDCGGDSRLPEVHRCWAEYYIGINELEMALRHMKIAAEVKPEYMVMVADVYREMGQRDQQIIALEKAKEHFKEKVNKEPLVHKQRILYARILKDLGEIDSAEQTLLSGVALKDDEEIRSACAGFYLMLFKESHSNSEFKKRFELLSKSLSHNENHIPTYEALIHLYRTEADSPAKKEIISALKSSINSDEPVALAHFALSNILWTENEFKQSEEHMEKAFKLDSRFGIVANNLAWLLAHSPQPDLDRAYNLAKLAVDGYPKSGRIRDTLATILMKQDKHVEALAEFQLALPTVLAKKNVHKKMATIYRKIGKNDLAQQHDIHARSLSE